MSHIWYKTYSCESLVNILHAMSPKKWTVWYFFNNLLKSWSNSNIRVSFEICTFSAFQNCPWLSILTKHKLRKLRSKTLGVHRNCRFRINKMTPCVFDLNFLSIYLIKIENQGQFWKAESVQISKLTLILEFDQDLRKLLKKYQTIHVYGTRYTTRK